MRFTKTIPHILTVFLLAFAGSLDAAALSMEGTAAIETFDSGGALATLCLLYTSDAADDPLCVDLGGRRLIKKKK